MSDIHIKVLLARVEMSGPAMMVMGDEGPRNHWARLVDDARYRMTACSYCGSQNHRECAPTAGDAQSPICAVRALEMQRSRREKP